MKSSIPDIKKICENTHVWIWFPKRKIDGFYEQLEFLQDSNLKLRNLIYVIKDSNNHLDYDVLAFITKSMNYDFYKNKVRITSRWKKHEFGNGKIRKNGKKPYHPDGKDPSNVWLEELTEEGSPYVIGLKGISQVEMFRRVLEVSTMKGDQIESNIKDFRDFAKSEGRIVKNVKKIVIDFNFNINIIQKEKVFIDIILPEINKIHHWDSKDPKLGLNHQIDLIVTSPPYYRQRDYGYIKQIGQETKYQKYIDNLNEVWKNCFNYLKDGGFFILNINNFMENGNITLTHWHMIKQLKQIGYKYHGTMIWYQPNSRRGLNKKNVCDAKEYLIVVSKNGKNKKLGDWVLRFPQLRGSLLPINNGKLIHPARFPEDLVEYYISLLTKEGDIVFDPFIGSGTVAKTANRMNRNWIGFELNEEYLKFIQIVKN